MLSPLTAVLMRHQQNFHLVVPFNPGYQHLASVDLSEKGNDLQAEVAGNLAEFQQQLDTLRERKKAIYLVGGYGELRSIYARSELFNSGAEPRRLHLGTDIWGAAGTPVFAFSGGMVHSLAYNPEFGDYGATLILLHQLEGIPFYTLYGHLSKKDIQNLYPGQYMVHGQTIAHFGNPEENGQWPPHLHIQVISDLGGRNGDFPGVCRNSEKEAWLTNCPDPDCILQFNRYLPNF
jgi:murein DD-endopeptidase MepM/ murein hydrolase activator NlpD